MEKFKDHINAIFDTFDTEAERSYHRLKEATDQAVEVAEDTLSKEDLQELRVWLRSRVRQSQEFIDRLYSK
jgi:uncharacterized damage-inducible protein DinB